MFSYLNKNSSFLCENGIISLESLFVRIEPLIVYLKQQEQSKVLIKQEWFLELFFASIFASKEIYLQAGASNQLPKSSDFIDIYDNIDEILNGRDFSKNNYDKTVDTDKIFLNFCTSGSTSTPKIVRKTLTNMFVEAKEILEEHNIEKDLTFYTTTQFPHLFGTTFAFFVPIVNGNTICTKQIKYPEQIDEKEFVFVSTPAFLSRIEKYDNPTEYNPQLIITAGAKLEEKVYNYYKSKSRILEIYGSTETGVIAYKHKFEDKLKLFKNVSLEQTDNDKIKVSSNFFNENYLIINDKVKIHKDRSIEFLDRSDRVLKINEKRINAIEIENNINENKFVKESYCFKHNEALVALVVLTKTTTNIQDVLFQLKKNLKTCTDLTVQKWRFLPEIPKTSTGKIDKIKLGKIMDLSLTFPIVKDIEQMGNSCNITLNFPSYANYFRGHFPKFPILPGVVQVYFAHFLAEFYFDIFLNFNEMKKIKFSKLIYPNSDITLSLTNEQDNVKFVYLKEEEILSSGIIKKDKRGENE